MSTLTRDMAYFDNMVGKVGTMGIGGYLSLLLAQNGLFTAPDSQFWFVNQLSGLDTNSGADPRDPFKTIQAAVDAAGSAADGHGDVIFLQSGRGTNYTGDTVGTGLADAYVYINKPDLTIVGLGPPQSVTIKPGAAATAGVFNLGALADRVTFANLTIDTTTAQSGAIVTTSGTHFLNVQNVFFNLVGAAGPLGVGIDMDAAASNLPVIKNCTFMMGTLLIAGIRMKCGATGGLIEDCRFISLETTGTLCPDVLNVKAGTGLHINRCYIHGGTGVGHLAADGIDIDAGVVRTMITDCWIAGCTAAVTDGGTNTIGETAGEGYIAIEHA